MKKRRPTRKNSFLLLELMLALALVLLCFFPLIRPHAYIEKEECKMVRDLQMERLAREAFVDVKKELYECAQSWQELKEGRERLLPRKATLFIGGKAIEYERKYTTSKIEEYRRKSNADKHLLLNIETSFYHKGKCVATLPHTLLIHQTTKEL